MSTPLFNFQVQVEVGAAGVLRTHCQCSTYAGTASTNQRKQLETAYYYYVLV